MGEEKKSFFSRKKSKETSYDHSKDKVVAACGLARGMDEIKKSSFDCIHAIPKMKGDGILSQLAELFENSLSRRELAVLLSMSTLQDLENFMKSQQKGKTAE